MKYRVHIKWQCIAETDAESEQDAINYVLHSALKPKLAETKAVPLVNGKSWMHATAEERPLATYIQRRIDKALPGWKKAFDLRAKGLRWDEVGKRLGCDKGRAHVMASKYEEYLLNQKTKKAA